MKKHTLKNQVRDIRGLRGAVLATVIVGGAGLGLLSALPAVEVMKAFSTNEFCVSCHTMTPMGETFTKSIHGGNNSTGFVADCVSCHLPHSNVVEELYVKGTSGIRHLWGEFVLGMEELDYDKLHPKRTDYVFDSGCLSCHKGLEPRALAATELSSVADQTHKLAFAHKDNDPDWQCASCHYDIAHPGLKHTMRQNAEEKLRRLTADLLKETQQ